MDGQTRDACRYGEHAAFVLQLAGPVLALLAPRPGERVLDLGCGDGTLARALCGAGCEVVAVDASPPFVEAARDRGVDARLMDGQALRFAAEFAQSRRRRASTATGVG